MTLSPHADAQTIAVYDENAAGYADMFDTGKPYPRLEAFLTGLAPGARLLDLGCGVGAMSARMGAAGHDVLSLDASEGMARIAKTRHGIEVRLGSFDDIPKLGKFDGIWAHFSLLHAQRRALPGYLCDIHQALHPGGRFLIGMKSGKGDARDGLGRHYTYVTEEELTVMMQCAGFTVTEIDTGASKGFDGVQAPWVIICAHG
ncbi:MAG: class I SAM-dependent methyltransferase [Mangrovicoccus sp.]|nr:class I SAM-dependent methyltransferase [Mangrovicoccus sp.]